MEVHLGNYKRYVVPVIFVAILVLGIFIIKPFIIPLLTSAAIAYIFYPVFRWVKKWIKNDTASALIVSILIILLITVPVIIAVNTVSKEAYAIYLGGKQILDNKDVLQECTLSACDVIRERWGDTRIQFYAQRILEAGTNFLIESGSKFVLSIPKKIVEVFITFFAVFYLLRDGRKLTARIRNLLKTKRDHKERILQRFNEVTYAVVYGNLLVAFIQGVIGAIGLFIFGVSSPLTWGFLMFLFALIPYIGTGIIWVPASLIMVAGGVLSNTGSLIGKGVGLFLYCLVFVAPVDNLLKPKIIGKKSGIHPVIVLVGILGGIMLFGIPGIVVGPVALAMALTFIDVYVDE